jgi:S-adenosylmethionine:diacylglycerol 3-amino-3-carboxypropyl transferase
MVRGRAETLMGFGRPLLAAAGWSTRRMRAFLDLDDTAQQVAMWRRDFDTLRFRAGMRFLFSAATLRAGYASPLVASLPPHFADVMRARMDRCFGTHPNRDNPFARALLMGELRDDAAVPRPGDVELACADAAACLEAAEPGSFDGFTLSNILDGANAAYRDRLFRAVQRAARPGAMVVLRSFGEPASFMTANRAAEDRSMLWGVVWVTRADTLPTAT